MVREGAQRSPVARRRFLIVILVTALTTLLAVGPATAKTPRKRLFAMLNAARQSHHRRPVRFSLKLSDTAKQHTRRMVRRDQLFDVPNLSQVLAPFNWSWGGSVEGCGSTLWGIHKAMMHHAAHRRIMLAPEARRVGIGVVKTTDRTSCGRNVFWVTEILYG